MLVAQLVLVSSRLPL